MRNLLNSWTVKSALYLGVSLAATGLASAQAVATGQRGAEIAPFFTTTYLRPDYGTANNLGYTIGADYTRYIQSIIQPSIEVRFTNASGTNVGEHSFTGGIKLRTTIFGLHPYGTLLAGTGTISFAQPTSTYVSDSPFVYSIGGGAEFDVRSSFQVRADLTQQHWELSPTILTPMTFSVGVAYRLPFHSVGIR